MSIRRLIFAFLILLTPVVVFAQEPSDLSQTLGKEVFSTRCVHCHESGVIEPNSQGIARLTEDEIYRTLWAGIMREAANGLTDAERRAVAQYVSNLNPDKPLVELSNYCAFAPGEGDRSLTGWNRWSPDIANTRNIGSTDFTLDQARNTRLKWAFVVPDTGTTTNAGNQATVVDGVLYLGSRNTQVYALDAATGCIHWVFDAVAGVRSAVTVEGEFAYFGDYESNVYAIDRRDGSLKWFTQADDQPSGRINGNVVLHDGQVFAPISSNQSFVNGLDPALPCCTFRGTVSAVDQTTGVLRWRARTFDDPLRQLASTPDGVPQYGPAGASTFSVPTIDAARNVLYVGTGEQHSGPWVGAADSVVAFDLATGEKRWRRSFAPDRWGGVDIWNGGCVGVLGDPELNCPDGNVDQEGDRDIAAPLVLVTRTDGRDLLLAGSKDGVLYALDPDEEGRVIWQTRVGQIIRVQGPSFGGVEHGLAADATHAYVPVSDVDVMEHTSAGALNAVNLMTGEIEWRWETSADACDGRHERCHTSVSAPPTVTDTMIIEGVNDGVLRIFDKATGEVIWRFDTTPEITGVNGLTWYGGSITRGGAAVVANMIYQTSGYGQGLGMPGHVLYAFEVPND